MKKILTHGTRVAWKSGKEWKTGTVVLSGDNAKNPKEKLKKEFALAYDTKKESKKPHSYVAADTPLFKPGYIVHCVPNHHLQIEETSWPYKMRLIEALPKKTLLEIVKNTLKAHCRLKSRCPKEIQEILEKLNPKSFPSYKTKEKNP